MTVSLPVRRSRTHSRAARPSRTPAALPWLAPLLAVATLFYLFPALQTIRLAFTDASLLREGASYTTDSLTQTLGDPSLPKILSITAIFVGASVVGQLVLGLGIALVIQRAVARGLHGAVFVRSVVLCAWVMPGILIGVIWSVLLSEGPFGLVTAALSTFGADEPIAFLSDPTLALMSVIVANVWRGTAFSMLLLYAGLQSVQRDLYEAAEVDGAGRRRQFWHITLPQLRGVLLVNVVLITIATLNTFDMILPLTGGGPAQATEVLALHTFSRVFVNFDLAGGSVLALLLLVIALGLTVVYRRLLRT